jgi:hypothetical protein
MKPIISIIASSLILLTSAEFSATLSEGSVEFEREIGSSEECWALCNDAEFFESTYCYWFVGTSDKAATCRFTNHSPPQCAITGTSGYYLYSVDLGREMVPLNPADDLICNPPPSVVGFWQTYTPCSPPSSSCVDGMNRWGLWQAVDVGGGIIDGPVLTNYHFRGTMVTNDRFVGEWTGAGATTCAAPSDYGYTRWGSIVLQFNAELTAFTGHWGYCDGPRDPREWNGYRE